MTDPNASSYIRRGVLVPDAPTVSVIMLVMADVTNALRGLDALDAASGTAVETVVVANGTPAAAADLLEARDDIVVVRSRANLGFAGGNNLAAGIARGRYFLLLNDDSVLQAGAVDRLVATAERDPSIGAVGARILSTDGTLQEAGSVLWRDGSAAHVGLGLPPHTDAYSAVRAVDYISANALLVRRDAWEAVGGLDPGYFPAYYEDVDFCLSLNQLGYRVVYEPRALLVHLESQSTSRNFRIFLLLRNRQRLVARWASVLDQCLIPVAHDDPGSITAAVERARGDLPRALISHVVRTPDGEAAVWALAEALARAGWGVTVSMSEPADTTMLDRMADLGVEVTRTGADQVRLAPGVEFDAVIADQDHFSAYATGARRAGRKVTPEVDIEFDEGRAVSSVVEEANRRAARAPKPRGAPRSGWYPERMSDDFPSSELGGRPALEDHAQMMREIEALRSEAAIKDEYIASFEAQIEGLRTELAESRAFLNAKTSYIESLPSVRLKKRLGGMRSRSK
jgi:GT2 family glycosyltransferase